MTLREFRIRAEAALLHHIIKTGLVLLQKVKRRLDTLARN